MKKPVRLFFWALLAGFVSLSLAGPARAQLTSTDEERLQILSDPEALKKKRRRTRSGRRSSSSGRRWRPFDVLPFVKPHHWSTDLAGGAGELRRLRGQLAVLAGRAARHAAGE